MAIRNAVADIRTMKTLFSAAENEAAGLGDQQPGAEHLFLAALTLDDVSARSVLATLGVTTDDVRSAINGVHATALSTIGVDTATAGLLSGTGSFRPSRGPYRSAGSAQELFQRARRLSAADRRSLLKAGHIALAAADTEHGTLARVLDSLDIDRARLGEAARAALAE
jgi:ATP-dependent Clp protease ATP-binding subunit ClpA